MHEVGLVTEALNQAIAAAVQAGALRIERLNFSVAEGGHVTPEAVATICDALGRDTIAATAEVSVRIRGDRFFCPYCSAAFRGTGGGAACPTCGTPGVADGDEPELILESIDIVEPEGS